MILGSKSGQKVHHRLAQLLSELSNTMNDFDGKDMLSLGTRQSLKWLFLLFKSRMIHCKVDKTSLSSIAECSLSGSTDVF